MSTTKKTLSIVCGLLALLFVLLVVRACASTPEEEVAETEITAAAPAPDEEPVVSTTTLPAESEPEEEIVEAITLCEGDDCLPPSTIVEEDITLTDEPAAADATAEYIARLEARLAALEAEREEVEVILEPEFEEYQPAAPAPSRGTRRQEPSSGAVITTTDVNVSVSVNGADVSTTSGYDADDSTVVDPLCSGRGVRPSASRRCRPNPCAGARGTRPPCHVPYGATHQRARTILYPDYDG